MGEGIFHPHEVAPYFLEKEKEGMVMYGRIDSKGTSDYGCSLDVAIDRSINGCEDCAKIIRSDVINTIAKQSDWGNEISMPQDVTGPTLDPGLLSMGIPECCVYPHQEQKHILGDQGLDIICNIVVSYNVSPEVIRARGVLACTIALLAERIGLSTRIIVGIATLNYSQIGHDFAVKLKDYATPLDIPLIAFWLISPAASRRIGFALMDATDSNSHYNGHYSCANTKYKIDRTKQIILDHGHMRKSMLDASQAVEEAKNILRENGVIR